MKVTLGQDFIFCPLNLICTIMKSKVRFLRAKFKGFYFYEKGTYLSVKIQVFKNRIFLGKMDFCPSVNLA